MTLSTVSSCSDDYLNKEVDLTLQAQNLFGDYNMTRGFHAQLYDYLPDAFVGYTDGQYRGASRDCMTDNAISFWNAHYYNSVLTDGFDATNHPFATFFWERNYAGIRGCNQFMLNARPDVVGNSEKPGDENRLYDRWIAEARVLRAILHMDLAGYFGDVPIVGDDANGTPIILSPATGIPPRSKCEDVLKWIADECDKYKDDLPFRYADEASNWGRINGATAYALRARALLYRASPLNNPNNDQKRWEEAAEAALDFIRVNSQQANPYRLYRTPDDDPLKNYYQCFVSDPTANNEYILSRSVWTTTAIEDFLTPCGFSGTATATGRTNPTQNLVDSYETINGLPIDKDDSYDPQNPYANRDPRLDQTILHHGSIWGDAYTNEERPVDVTFGTGLDYASIHGGTLTGYYTKKFCANISWTTHPASRHACPIFRYAEVLLTAAEALNEAGNGEAYKYVDEVRSRVGMPSYKGLGKEELRERIRNERRIELCFEDHRFFDERRWKLFEGNTASSEKTKPYYQQVYNLYGVTVRPESSKMYNFGAAEVHPLRTFNSPKNYYFPIPRKEVITLKYEQTPGWEL